MKKVITYGTFDLLHQGHVNLLKRAKELGDYLIVGVTTDSFDRDRGKLNVRNNVMERIESVRQTGLADEIIIEEYLGQKIDDIQKYNVDIFAIGSDWTGKFDYLKEYCTVHYLERTQGVSSTMLRNESQKVVLLGVIGTGRIAHKFIPESEFVNGVVIKSIYNPLKIDAESFAKKFNINLAISDLDEFIADIDAVYIASPHLTHYSYIKMMLEHGKHVLCEIPMVLKAEEARELYDLAESLNLVLMVAHKTAHCPAFNHLITLVKSGVIGSVVDIEASLSTLSIGELRELDAEQAGGSITENVSFALLPIFKLLGLNYKEIHFFSKYKDGVDIYTKGIIQFNSALASFKVGLGVKTEGNLVISGTKGYVYVPAPWWKTDYFELRFEDINENKKYFYMYEADGLRYELQEFISCINNGLLGSHRLKVPESVAMAEIIEKFRLGENVKLI